MAEFLVKNKLPYQITVDLMPSPSPDKIIVMPPRAVRPVEMTDEEKAYVAGRYGKELIIKRKQE